MITRPNPRTHNSRVLEHLAEHGFTGRTDIESHTEAGQTTTTLRRGAGSVPWTDRVHAWLKDTLSTLPGVERVTATNTQTVTITWEPR